MGWTEPRYGFTGPQMVLSRYRIARTDHFRCYIREYNLLQSIVCTNGALLTGQATLILGVFTNLPLSSIMPGTRLLR